MRRTGHWSRSGPTHDRALGAQPSCGPVARAARRTPPVAARVGVGVLHADRHWTRSRVWTVRTDRGPTGRHARWYGAPIQGGVSRVAREPDAHRTTNVRRSAGLEFAVSGAIDGLRRDALDDIAGRFILKFCFIAGLLTLVTSYSFWVPPIVGGFATAGERAIGTAGVVGPSEVGEPGLVTEWRDAALLRGHWHTAQCRDRTRWCRRSINRCRRLRRIAVLLVVAFIKLQHRDLPVRCSWG